MTEINEDTRTRMAEFLPDAIERAIESYRHFLAVGPAEIKGKEDPAKNFKSHHDACKVAIAHIDLLIKLAQSIAALKDVDAQKQKELLAAVKKANSELKR